MTLSKTLTCPHGCETADSCKACHKIHYARWRDKKRQAALALGLPASYRGRLPMSCGCIEVCLCEEI